MPSRTPDAMPLERTYKMAVFFVAAATFTLAAHAYLGMHSVAAESDPITNAFPIAYAAAVGISIFLFWRIALRVVVRRDIRVRYNHIVVAVFLALVMPAAVWPATTGIAGVSAISAGMNRVLDQSLAHLEDHYRQTAAVGALAADLRTAVYEQEDTALRAALARLHEWVLSHRGQVTETHSAARQAAERMREIANSATVTPQASVQFTALNEQIVTASYALADIYPASVLADVSTELARSARRSETHIQTVTDLSVAFGRLAEQTTRISPPRSTRIPSPMLTVVQDWPDFAFAWSAAAALALLPLVSVIGLSGARSLNPRPVMTTPASGWVGLAYRGALVVAIVCVCAAIADRATPLIEAARPVTSVSPIRDANPIPEPNIRRYDPSDGARTTIPELGRSVSEWEMAQPMTFSLSGNSVVAVGKITERTPGQFIDFARSSGAIGTLVLNSPGGSVDGAIALGRLVREMRLRTAVPEGGYCASACPLVLASGVARAAGPQAVVGIHQVYAPDTSNPTPELLALSIAEVQKTVARVQEHLATMGVDPAVWMNALVTGAGELYVLSPDEMRASFLTTDDVVSVNENES